MQPSTTILVSFPSQLPVTPNSRNKGIIRTIKTRCSTIKDIRDCKEKNVNNQTFTKNISKKPKILQWKLNISLNFDLIFILFSISLYNLIIKSVRFACREVALVLQLSFSNLLSSTSLNRIRTLKEAKSIRIQFDFTVLHILWILIQESII